MSELPFNPVTAILEAVAACLCAEIQNPANGVPDVCFCGIVPGDNTPAMYAGNCKTRCGMAWTRLITLYPSNAVGATTVEPARCDTGMGIDIEVGMLRCISVGDERGNLPTPQEQTDAVKLQLADAFVMWKALLCCTAFPSGDVILTPYQPIGPEGGLVGGRFTASMGV